MTGIIAQNVGRTSGLIKSAGGGGGVWTLISTFTSDGSDATATFDSGIDSTYPIYVFKFINIHPETDNVGFMFNGRDGSTAYDAIKTTTNFKAYANEGDDDIFFGYDTSRDLAQSTDFQLLVQDIGNDNDQSCSGELWLFNPSSTTFVKHFYSRMNGLYFQDYIFAPFIAGYFNVTAAIDGIQFKFSADEIQGGKIKLYGLKDSA